ncbi:DUF2493 domain-containing protein [Paraburkholderia phenoliruptrix]|uniref:DUF2493 domain-containing protein n=1 Tax=Paraburkholderia phenoliruptrix TaxID=252970 RepID=UPI0034CED03E
MRLIVCGGRDYDDWVAIYAALDRAHAKRPITLLIHGACETGADKHAENWAKDREIPYLGVPAQWKKHGKRAGPLRNQKMLDHTEPAGVVAFPGGSGTADMTRRARGAGLKVWEPCA